MYNFPLAGGALIGVTVEEALAAGVNQADIDVVLAESQKLRDRGAIRGKIRKEAGDIPSLLGTTSDASTIAVLVGASLMASMNETTFAAFRTTLLGHMQTISGAHDPIQIATDFLASLAAGDIRLPALEKGIVDVLDEVTSRSNAVAEAINPQPAS